MENSEYIFRLHCKTRAIKQYGTDINRNRSVQHDRTEITLDTYDQLIFDRGGKTVQWETDDLFSKSC